jgi:hypothetical protein
MLQQTAACVHTNSTVVAAHSSFCAYSSDNAARHALHVSKSLVLCFRQGRDDLLEPLSPVCLAHVTPLSQSDMRANYAKRALRRLAKKKEKKRDHTRVYLGAW